MTAKLTTHILDIANGRPAAGVKVELYRNGELLATTTTNQDGRCSDPLLEAPEMFDDVCELHFHIGDYFRSNGIDSPFLDVVPIRFRLTARESFHVPLVCSPWSYSTYRGS